MYVYVHVCIYNQYHPRSKFLSLLKFLDPNPGPIQEIDSYNAHAFNQTNTAKALQYAFATISRLLKIIGLFCRISSLL